MVCEWGMSEELGPLTYGKKEEQIFLGREIAQHRDFSEETARQIDVAVKRIIVEAADKVTRLLEDNRDILSRMAEDLLEKETIVLEDIVGMIEDLRPGMYTDKLKPQKPAARAKPRPTPAPVAEPVVEEEQAAAREEGDEAAAVDQPPEQEGSRQ
jgi:cell division protease FtsH